MLKVVTPDSFGFAEPVARLVKLAAGGLRGDDLRTFVKRAGHDFLSCLADLRPGEVPVHAIALGAHEAIGPNRNGDSFSISTCRKCHDTFTKYAHLFRNHDNKPTSLRYGRVVKSAYHEPMRRIELLLALYGTADAARRGDGDLGRVADRELEKLSNENSFADSMACRVAYDVCSHCNNKAAHRGEYCDTVPVKLASGRVVPPCSGFGCRHGLTKVARDGSIQHVDNPDPVFFDISHVEKPADRIAYALGVLEKAAAVPTIGGAALAERWGLVDAPAACGTPHRAVAVLDRLVAAEAAGRLPDPADFKAAAAPLAAPAVLSAEPTGAPAAFRALADAGVCLGADDGLELVLGKQAAAAAAAEVRAAAPGALAALARDPGRDALLADNPYRPDAEPAPAAWRHWADKQAIDRGGDPAAVERRFRRAALRGAVPAGTTKIAAAPGPGALALAREYARYRVAFFENRPDLLLTSVGRGAPGDVG